jgi:3'-5' exonuclease
MSVTIFLDLETIPAQNPDIRERIAANITAPSNYSKPESIQKWLEENRDQAAEDAWRKTSFDGGYGQIVCASIAFDDGPVQTFYKQNWQESEPFIIAELFSAISAHTFGLGNDVFVGHNIAAFDLRFLFQRAVVHGIRPPAAIPFHAPEWDNRIFDTMIKWAGRGNRVKLDELCTIFGLKNKGELDGSKVWDYVKDGRIDEVAHYCADDVGRVRQLHRLMTFAGK